MKKPPLVGGFVFGGEGGLLSFRVASAKTSSLVELGTAFGILRERLVASAALFALNVRKLTLAYAATSRFGLVVEPVLFRFRSIYIFIIKI